MERKSESLHHDLKKIQQFRTLSLNYGPSVINQNVLQKALESIQNKIISSPSLKYYIDIALRVEKTWKGHPITETRKSDVPWGGFAPEKLDDANIYRPSAIIFTGSPNEEADDRIRKELVGQIPLPDGLGKIEVNVQSRTAYGKMFFNTTDFEQEDWKKLNLSLLLFQVKAARPELSASPELFERVEVGNLKPICWGLLVGDIDGFVLYSQKFETVYKAIEDNAKETHNEQNFLSLIIPNRLYLLSANQFFYNSVTNFGDIWSMIGYTNISDWKNEWKQ